jgi:hypothetical protein
MNFFMPQTSIVLEWTDKPTGAVQYLRFDVVTNETREALAEITEHPVEDGAPVVDHSRTKPKTLSITGYVSNKPLWSNPKVEDVASFKTKDIKVPLPTRGQRPSRVELKLPTPPIQPNLASAVSAGIGAIAKALGLGPGKTYATLAKEPEAGSGSYKPTVLVAKDDFPDRAVAIHDKLVALQASATLITVSSRMGQLDNMMISKVGAPRTPETGNGAEIQVDLTQVRFVKSKTVDAPLAAEPRGQKNVSKGAQAAKKDDKKKSAQKLESLLSKGTGLGADTPNVKALGTGTSITPGG